MIDAASKDSSRVAVDEARVGPSEYLGPAEVTRVRSDAVVVSLPEGRSVQAGLAFAVPYQPVVGDVLLVIGRGASHWALGVIVGSGRSTLSLQGDVDVRAIGGKLSLSGDRGVELHGPEVGIYTKALRMVARDMSQRFESVCQRVSSLLSVHAGESQLLVEGSATTQAKRATILTDETVTINGREVHLG
jgi:hypothetical protein